MDIKSIKQSLFVTTAQPMYELVKLISDKDVEVNVAKMLSGISITTISEYICSEERLPMREVVVQSGKFKLELRFINLTDRELNPNHIESLKMIWVVGDDKMKILELDEMFERMCAYSCMDEVAELLLVAMEYYRSLPVSHHAVSVKYEHYFNEGDEVSVLNVIIDKAVHKEVCRLERYEDEDVQYLSKANQFFLLVRFLNRLETIKFDHDTFVEI